MRSEDGEERAGQSEPKKKKEGRRGGCSLLLQTSLASEMAGERCSPGFFGRSEVVLSRLEDSAREPPPAPPEPVDGSSPSSRPSSDHRLRSPSGPPPAAAVSALSPPATSLFSRAMNMHADEGERRKKKAKTVHTHREELTKVRQDDHQRTPRKTGRRGIGRGECDLHDSGSVSAHTEDAWACLSICGVMPVHPKCGKTSQRRPVSSYQVHANTQRNVLDRRPSASLFLSLSVYG